MPCQYCEICEKLIDLDEDVEHEENHKIEEIEYRLEYLKGEIVAERISYSEIAELQSLAEFIEPGDNLLLEWAGALEGRIDDYGNILPDENGEIVLVKKEIK